MAHARHIRKTVENFQADSEVLDAERAAVEELKKRLDDPEAKATSEHYDAVKIRVEEDEMETDVDADLKLFQERQRRQLGESPESTPWFHENKERYYVKFNEDQVRDAERRHAQREAEDRRAGASQPAFQAQIEYCQTLIDYLSGKSIVPGTTTPVHASPMLATRQVAAVADSIVPLKRRGEEEKDYFIGTKEGRRLKKGPMAHSTFVTGAMSSASSVNLPSSSLSALRLLSVLPPSSQADVPRVVKDLEAKKTWFEAKQAREAMAKVPGLASTFSATAEPMSGVEAGKTNFMTQKMYYC